MTSHGQAWPAWKKESKRGSDGGFYRPLHNSVMRLVIFIFTKVLCYLSRYCIFIGMGLDSHIEVGHIGLHYLNFMEALCQHKRQVLRA